MCIVDLEKPIKIDFFSLAGVRISTYVLGFLTTNEEAFGGVPSLKARRRALAEFNDNQRAYNEM